MLCYHTTVYKPHVSLQESLANAKVNARQHCVVWSHSNAGNAIWRTTMFHVVAIGADPGGLGGSADPPLFIVGGQLMVLRPRTFIRSFR